MRPRSLLDRKSIKTKGLGIPTLCKQTIFLTNHHYSLLDPSNVTTPYPQILPDSGSNQPWFKYLYCVQGTQTYLFLNNGRLEPPPLTYRDIRSALAQAIVQAQNKLTQLGDGPITAHYNGFMTPSFNWSVFLQPIEPLLKPNGSPETLSWDSRAPPESLVLTWTYTTGT